MKLLGAVLAGGRSSRFGSDKALAVVNGRRLIDGVIADLATQVDMVIVCGRDWPGTIAIADQPRPALGPLGGLCAALNHAAASGFDAVLTAPCDAVRLPAGLAALLCPGPAVASGQRTIGRWPVSLAPLLTAELARPEADRSLRGWCALVGAATIDCGPIRSINTPGDLPPA